MSGTPKFDYGIEYLQPAIGRTRYWYWPPSMDTVPAGPGAYAANRPAPPIANVIEGGVFCAGVINLIRRRNRKIVPYRPSLPPAVRNYYDGGTWACQEFWGPYIRRFSRWAVYPRGTLIGRYYSAARLAAGDQGHVAVLLGEQDLAAQRDPMILHSHPAVGGLARTRLGASHAGGYYEWAVMPWDWIEHDKSGF